MSPVPLFLLCCLPLSGVAAAGNDEAALVQSSLAFGLDDGAEVGSAALLQPFRELARHSNASTVTSHVLELARSGVELTKDGLKKTERAINAMLAACESAVKDFAQDHDGALLDVDGSRSTDLAFAIPHLRTIVDAYLTGWDVYCNAAKDSAVEVRAYFAEGGEGSSVPGMAPLIAAFISEKSLEEGKNVMLGPLQRAQQLLEDVPTGSEREVLKKVRSLFQDVLLASYAHHGKLLADLESGKYAKDKSAIRDLLHLAVSRTAFAAPSEVLIDEVSTISAKINNNLLKEVRLAKLLGERVFKYSSERA